MLYYVCNHVYLYRAKKFDDKATWKANDDGTVNTDGPRMIVGGEGMGMTGGFLTKYVLNLARATLGSQCCTNVSSHSFLFLLFFYCYRCNHFYLLSVCLFWYFLSMAWLFRSKNFERSGGYNKTWKSSEDGTVNTNGPRVIVDQGNGVGSSGGYITKYVFRLPPFLLTLTLYQHTNKSTSSFHIPWCRYPWSFNCLLNTITKFCYVQLSGLWCNPWTSFLLQRLGYSPFSNLPLKNNYMWSI